MCKKKHKLKSGNSMTNINELTEFSKYKDELKKLLTNYLQLDVEGVYIGDIGYQTDMYEVNFARTFKCSSTTIDFTFSLFKEDFSVTYWKFILRYIYDKLKKELKPELVNIDQYKEIRKKNESDGWFLLNAFMLQAMENLGEGDYLEDAVYYPSSMAFHWKHNPTAKFVIRDFKMKDKSVNVSMTLYLERSNELNPCIAYKLKLS